MYFVGLLVRQMLPPPKMLSVRMKSGSSLPELLLVRMKCLSIFICWYKNAKTPRKCNFVPPGGGWQNCSNCAYEICEQPIRIAPCAYEICQQPLRIAPCAYEICEQPLRIAPCAYEICEQPLSLRIAGGHKAALELHRHTGVTPYCTRTRGRRLS